MDERQYLQALQNRRAYHPKSLLQGPAGAGLLRSWAQAQRKLEAARQAWQRLQPAETAALSEPVSIQDGLLVIAVSGRHELERLRSRAPEMLKALDRALPGLKRIHFVPASLEATGER
jgi:hypothetical protein